MFPKSWILIMGLLYATAVPSSSDKSTENEESKDNEETSYFGTVPDKNLLCGLRNSNGVGSIGKEMPEDLEYAKFGEYPWLVSISEEIEMDVHVFACTGAIISPKAIVSTAHCVEKFVKNPRALVVEAGIWNSSAPNNEYPAQKRYANDVAILDHFEKGFQMNDIAVIAMEKPFDLRDHIQPIRLPAVWQSFEDQKCILNYWDVVNGNIRSMKADLLVVSSKECEKRLSEHKATKDLPVHESIVCAASDGSFGDCDKQLGAPLICPIPGATDRYYLAGLVSIGYGCNDGRYVGLFVNIAHLRRWIVSVDV